MTSSIGAGMILGEPGGYIALGAMVCSCFPSFVGPIAVVLEHLRGSATGSRARRTFNIQTMPLPLGWISRLPNQECGRSACVGLGVPCSRLSRRGTSDIRYMPSVHFHHPLMCINGTPVIVSVHHQYITDPCSTALASDSLLRCDIRRKQPIGSGWEAAGLSYSGVDGGESRR